MNVAFLERQNSNSMGQVFMEERLGPSFSGFRHEHNM